MTKNAYAAAQLLVGTIQHGFKTKVVNDKEPDQDSAAEHVIDMDIVYDGNVYNVSLTVTAMGPVQK